MAARMADLFCTNCGQQFTNGDSFCRRCGARLTGPWLSGPGPYHTTPSAPQRSGPTVALVVGVVVIVAAAAILGGAEYGVFLGRAFCDCPGNTPIGAAFSLGVPTTGHCSPADTFVADGCQGPADFYYRIGIVNSTVTFGSVWLVVQSSSGAIDVSSGARGFTILYENGKVAAQYATSGGSMAMVTDWSYGTGVSDSTPVSTTEYIVIDMGAQNPAGQGLEFFAHGVGSYSGTTNPIALP
ncbi:MAG: hypothetical protein ABSB90_06425 [Thermoplasmata archaeon]|jgi:hypothetical protein